jgi:hypothetical protein
MAPYSLDLRKRVLRAWDSGLDVYSVAAKYEVSRAWVHRLVQRRRETGSITPRKQTKFRSRVAISLPSRSAPSGLTKVIWSRDPAFTARATAVRHCSCAMASCPSPVVRSCGKATRSAGRRSSAGAERGFLAHY